MGIHFSKWDSVCRNAWSYVHEPTRRLRHCEMITLDNARSPVIVAIDDTYTLKMVRAQNAVWYTLLLIRTVLPRRPTSHVIMIQTVDF